MKGKTKKRKDLNLTFDKGPRAIGRGGAKGKTEIFERGEPASLA